jgi:cyclopropane fatty-acyl-phospholipid synthase-like methyltransferase
MVELCRQKGLTAYVMDMADIRFPAGSFDAIYSMNSLLHLTKAEFPAVLRSIDRLLKTDGVVFIGMYGGRDHEGV